MHQGCIFTGGKFHHEAESNHDKHLRKRDMNLMQQQESRRGLSGLSESAINMSHFIFNLVSTLSFFPVLFTMLFVCSSGISVWMCGRTTILHVQYLALVTVLRGIISSPIENVKLSHNVLHVEGRGHHIVRSVYHGLPAIQYINKSLPYFTF